MGFSGRVLLLMAYAALLSLLIVPAYNSLADTGNWAGTPLNLCLATMLIPAIMLVISVVSRYHSLAWSVFWTWSLIFLGLAPAYQLSSGTLPWGSVAQLDLVAQTQTVILVGYAAAVVAFVVTAIVARLRKAPKPFNADAPALRKTATTLLGAYVVISSLFILLMGTALFEGRAIFSARLVEMPASLGVGTAYFISTAGAMVLPATGIVLRRRGVPIKTWLIVACSVTGFIVTNPLIGSRFLTGSFLVSIVAVLVSPVLRRWMPAGIIVLFVTIFPTLDLLRGDGTGSTHVQVTDPSTTLTTLDYDAFEMLYRAVSLNGHIAQGLPSRTDLIVAPLLRWIPFLSERIRGDATGPVVAQITGMSYTNVSMPLWGEAFFLGSWTYLIIMFAIVGAVIAMTRRARSLAGEILEAPIAALLFIILRGSLYEVLGYALLAALIAGGLSFASRRRSRPVAAHPDRGRIRHRQVEPAVEGIRTG